MTRARDISNSSITNPAIINAKGDLIVGTAADTASNLTVGTDGQVLTAASGQTTGLQWATPSSGGMTLLSTTSLSSTATTISSISQSYTNLFILIQNPYVNAADALVIKFNSTIPATQYIATGAVSQSTQLGGNLSTSSSAGNQNIAVTLSNYADTSYGKPFFFNGIYSSGNATIGGGSAQTVAAITSITLTTAGGGATFSGGRVLIYGVK